MQKETRQTTEAIGRLLLRPREVAKAIGVSRSKVYELIASGSLPSVRLEGGRLIRVPLTALQKLAEKAEPNPQGDGGEAGNERH